MCFASNVCAIKTLIPRAWKIYEKFVIWLRNVWSSCTCPTTVCRIQPYNKNLPFRKILSQKFTIIGAWPPLDRHNIWERHPCYDDFRVGYFHCHSATVKIYNVHTKKSHNYCGMHQVEWRSSSEMDFCKSVSILFLCLYHTWHGVQS